MKRLILASSLLLAATGALAAASSTVHINGVTITLTDLDLNDGIAASATMMHGSQPYLNIGSASFDPAYSNDAQAGIGTHGASQLHADVGTTFSHSSATIAGQPSIVGYSSIALEGAALSSAVGYGEYGATAAPYTAMNVQVAANTRVTVTFDASIDVATTVGLDAAGNAERAMGRILMAFDGLDADGAWVIDEQFQELVAGYRVDNAGNVLGDTLHWDGQLSVSFANWTGSDTVATLYSEGVIGGSSVVSAVPEPATYGMLLGGLALLGVAARRKKAAC
ncbi:FxDxF family PEP-CTERM protein [Pseudoduganella lutea]|nr:FxDxF family PEP-CTERM protein [Pseudoduganella lutea]